MIGIDEVGRGAWAGPLLVVAFRRTASLPTTITDSKKLSSKQRQALMMPIERAGHIGEGWVWADEIDQIGLARAMAMGVERALMAIDARYEEEIVMDGPVNYCPPLFMNVRTVIRADALFQEVGAASIAAKVKRDNYMKQCALQFPDYGFDRHVGYGTTFHAAALKQCGPCEQHRQSFRPLAGGALIGNEA